MLTCHLLHGRDPDSRTSLTNLAVFSPQTQYIYQPRNLWLAYGLAILFAIIGSILGFIALMINHASFSNSFSTVLRVTQNPALFDIIQYTETSGAEPIPKQLADIKVSLSDDNGQIYASLVVGESGRTRVHGAVYEQPSRNGTLSSAGEDRDHQVYPSSHNQYI